MTAPAAILAGMTANAEILGPTPSGGAFMLLEIDNDLLGQLEVLDADEARPNGDDEARDVRVGGNLQLRDLAAYWPVSPALMRLMVESGYGNRRAARLLGGHHATYRARRRALLGASGPGSTTQLPASPIGSAWSASGAPRSIGRSRSSTAWRWPHRHSAEADNSGWSPSGTRRSTSGQHRAHDRRRPRRRGRPFAFSGARLALNCVERRDRGVELHRCGFDLVGLLLVDGY